MLLWINFDIVYLCSQVSSLCCIGLIVTLFIYVLMALSHFALDWVWHCLSVFSWLFLVLHWIDCDIVYLCCHDSSSCRIGLSVALFICVLMIFLMLRRIEYFIIYLCSNGSSSGCIWLIVTLFICVLMVLPRVALDWLWHCLSVFSWIFLMFPWIDCGIVYLSSHSYSSCCIGLIVTFLSVFSWIFLMLHWIDCGIVYLSSHSYSSCCIGLIVTFLSVFSWIFLMLTLIDCGMVYLSSHRSSSCCIWLIVTLFICVLMVLSHVAFD